MLTIPQPPPINDHPDIRRLFDGLPTHEVQATYSVSASDNATRWAELFITTPPREGAAAVLTQP